MIRFVKFAPCLLFVTACAHTDSGEDLTTSDPAEIAKIKEHLEPFVRATTWNGDRWKVVGMSDGFPVTEGIGPWEISVQPTDKDGVFSLRGIRVGKECTVELDTNRGVLSIDGTSFVGKPLTGKSCIVRGAPFKGAVFECNQLNISGSAAILVLDDGRLLFDFYKVRMHGGRGEYGILSSKKVEGSP